MYLLKEQKGINIWEYIVYLSSSGSSAEAKEDLYKRGLKALLKFKKSFNLYKPKIKTLLHIFDHTVKPVLLYGSEVWGTSMVNKINKEERFLFNLSENMKQENVHIKFCKFSLGVGKRTTNIAVLGELGRYPLLLEVILNIQNVFRYFKHLFQILQISAFVFLKFYRSPENKSSDPIYYTGSRYLVRSISLG